MKTSKEAKLNARRLFRLCTPQGQLDVAALNLVVDELLASKPKGYQAILQELGNSLRLYRRIHSIVITSAEPLDEQRMQTLQQSIASKYGQNYSYEWKTDASLIGGLVIQVGDNLADASIKTRINKLLKTTI